MKCYRKVLRIPWIAHRTNCSILNELHLPTNWMYNFVRRQKLKYFGHVTRHNGLEKTIMQGMVAGKRSRGKPRQRWEKDITDTFGTMTAASRVAEDRKQFRSDIWAATSWRGYAPRERESVSTDADIVCDLVYYTMVYRLIDIGLLWSYDMWLIQYSVCSTATITVKQHLNVMCWQTRLLRLPIIPWSYPALTQPNHIQASNLLLICVNHGICCSDVHAFVVLLVCPSSGYNTAPSALVNISHFNAGAVSLIGAIIVDCDTLRQDPPRCQHRVFSRISLARLLIIMIIRFWGGYLEQS